MSSHIDALKGLIEMTAHLYIIDLKALPEGTYATSPMGVARTPQDISTEIAGFNRLCRALLSNNVHESTEGQMIESPEAAETAIRESAAALASTIVSMSPEALQEKVTAPWGQEMSKYDLAQMAPLNTMYHDGQLNYFQALHGAGEMHWH